jgi:putative ABC transport system ATP-binding protein
MPKRQASSEIRHTGIPPAVLLDRVGKIYGTGASAVTALRDVSYSFARGSFTAIMGRSGSGKTTLLQCAAGLTHPTSGRVSVGGADLTAMKDAELATMRGQRVGFVFQAFNLLPALTAKENIELPLRLAGKRADQEWVRELVTRTEIADHAHRRPHELSGGQQQRVAICRALVTGPEVVFADEPTGNLDTRSGQEILSMLRLVVDTLRQTVIVVTHDQAAAYADRVLYLRDGQVAEGLGDQPSSPGVTSPTS